MTQFSAEEERRAREAGYDSAKHQMSVVRRTLTLLIEMEYTGRTDTLTTTAEMDRTWPEVDAKFKALTAEQRARIAKLMMGQPPEQHPIATPSSAKAGSGGPAPTALADAERYAVEGRTFPMAQQERDDERLRVAEVLHRQHADNGRTWVDQQTGVEYTWDSAAKAWEDRDTRRMYTWDSVSKRMVPQQANKLPPPVRSAGDAWMSGQRPIRNAGEPWLSGQRPVQRPGDSWGIRPG